MITARLPLAYWLGYLLDMRFLVVATEGDGVVTRGQIAGLDALQGPQGEAQDFVAQLRQGAELMVMLLNEIDGIHCLPPRGAFYAFRNVTGACRRAGIADAGAVR